MNIMKTVVPQHYSPRLSYDSTALSNLEEACRHLGITPPTRLTDVSKVLTGIPTTEAVARQAAAQALTAPDLAAWRDESLGDLVESLAADALRKAWAVQATDRQATRRLHSDALAAITKDLQRIATKTIAELESAAAKLPQHDPLDAAAVLDSDCGPSRRSAIDALSTLSHLSQMLRIPAHGGLPRSVAVVLPITDTQETGPELVDAMSRNPIGNPDPTRESVRRFIHDLQDANVDELLIRAARGEYPGVELSYTVSHAELAARVARINESMTDLGADRDQRRAALAGPVQIK